MAHEPFPTHHPVVEPVTFVARDPSGISTSLQEFGFFGDLLKDLGRSLVDEFLGPSGPTVTLPPPPPPPPPTFGPTTGGPCPPLTFRGPSGTCIDLFALPPGGRPAVTAQTVVPSEVGQGIFGMLSTEPFAVGQINGRPILRCPIPSLVLAKDNRCYSKRDLPNKLRKWPKRKAICATDRKIAAIKGAGAAAKSLQASFKGSGYKISRTR